MKKLENVLKSGVDVTSLPLSITLELVHKNAEGKVLNVRKYNVNNNERVD